MILWVDGLIRINSFLAASNWRYTTEKSTTYESVGWQWVILTFDKKNQKSSLWWCHSSVKDDFFILINQTGEFLKTQFTVVGTCKEHLLSRKTPIIPLMFVPNTFSLLLQWGAPYLHSMFPYFVQNKGYGPLIL